MLDARWQDYWRIMFQLVNASLTDFGPEIIKCCTQPNDRRLAICREHTGDGLRRFVSATVIAIRFMVYSSFYFSLVELEQRGAGHCVFEYTPYSIVYMYHIFLTQSSVEGNLGCFQVLAITNNAAMNIGFSIMILMNSSSLSLIGLLELSLVFDCGSVSASASISYWMKAP
ncbi:hypothetical protein STEG23_017833 [Scotinomys teguina]